MDNRDISNIGEQIRNSVQDAIDSMDFKQLNRTISDTVNTALDEARKQLGKGLDQSRPGEVYRTNYGEGGVEDRRRDSSAGVGGRSQGRAYGGNENRSQGQAYGGSGDRSQGQAYGANGTGAQGRAFMKNEPGSRKQYGDNKRSAEEPGYRPFQTSRENRDSGKTERMERTERTERTEKTREPRVTGAKFTPNGRIAGILFTVFGGIGLGITGILFLVVCLLGLLVKPLWGAMIGSSVLVMLLGGVFGTMFGTGVSIRGRLRRAKRYLELAGNRLYCDIEELARNVGKSRKYVVRDIQRLIEKGILPEAHLDDKKMCLILSDETYRQYLDSQKALKIRQEEEKLLKQEKNRSGAEAKAAAKAAGKPENSSGDKEKLPEGLEQMMAQGRNYTRILREANDAIPGEVISAKIGKLETVIRKIFESVERHPEQMEEMGKFMDYYLPTTVKLVNAYRDFDQVAIEGENIVSAKHEIEETLDTINRAFERLLDDLYQDAVMDITTDASVLQTMLEKDGFAGSDFDK